MFGSSYLNHLDMSSYWVLDMNTRFKVFASYNILQYLFNLSMFLYLKLSQNAEKVPN
jgi:hypothetical protein